MNEPITQLSHEERVLYDSALQVRRSEFWNYYMAKVDEIIEMNKDDIVDATIRGDNARALLCASKIRGLELAKEEMDNVINSLEVTTLNQELEEEYA
jgi:hypothetical protein